MPEGAVWIETLKAGGHASVGLYQRRWEARIDGPKPALAASAALVGADSKWHRVLTEPALAKGLAPIFNSVFRRTLWPLRLPHGALVELALGQGELHQDDVREPISEVVLELKAGDPAALPWLHSARRVHVLEETNEPVEDPTGELDIGQYLQLHGIVSAHRHCAPAAPVPGNAGALSLSFANEVVSGLVVLGCYGHNQAHEFMRGGATRSVLQTMTLPVLMAH